MKTRIQRILAGLAALMVAAIIWLPCLHLLFTRPLADFRQDPGLSPKARQLAARHLQLWTDPALREQELNKMRASNAEWDFMGRSFLVWSLANMSLRDPASKALYLRTMDQIIDETLRLEILLYLAFVILVPVLVLAAMMLAVGQRFRRQPKATPGGTGERVWTHPV